MAITHKQWSQAKSPADIVLEGVDVELDWDGTTINGVVICDANGNALRIIKGEYCGMRAMVRATVEKYRLHGTLCESPFEQVFDEKHEAEARQEEFSELGDKAHLVIEKVKVPA